MTEDTFILRSASPDFCGRPSVSFQDFGRESLGILPPDFGRDSLGFLNISSSVNRNSLTLENILQFSDFGQDSVEYGRESLGILNQSVLDINFGDELNTAFVFQSPRKSVSSLLDNKERTPKIKLTTIKESNDTVFTEAVDTAFLFPSPRRLILSSISSQNSGVPSFHSGSLEGPSKIYSLSRSHYTFPSINNLDISLGNSDLNKAKLISSPESVEQRPRIKSMPNAEACVTNFDNNICRKFWSTGKTNSKSLLRTNVPIGKLDFDENKEDNFYDSIFIEGSYIAQKIADGSIFNDSNVLESTTQPSWPSDLDESDENEKKTVNTETVFKTIDKLLPERLHKNNGILKPQQCDNSPNEPQDVKGILQNLSEILNNSHRSDKERSQGHNLLSSLAEMLHGNSSRSQRQNLDDSGHSSFVEQNESPNQDKHECYEVLDLSKKSSDEESNKMRSFDISSKGEVKQRMNRRLSQSFCAPTPSIKVSKPDIKIRNSSVGGLESIRNESVNSNSSSRSNDSHGSAANMLPNKFKSKPSSGISNRGPLKAIIPVKDMKRKSSNIAVTPEKSQQQSALSLKSKRTSTPINEPKLKPMAASTPSYQDTENKQAKGSKRKSSPGNLSKEISPEQPRKLPTPTRNRASLPSSSSTEVASERQKRQHESPSNRKSLPSPLSKNVPAVKPKKAFELPRYQRSPASSSVIPSKSKVVTGKSELASTKPVRRNSVSENVSKCDPKLKRSNSLGKETGIMSSLSRVRENLMKSGYFQGERKALLENNHFGMRKMESDPSLVPTKTLPKPKISNKENAK